MLQQVTIEPAAWSATAAKFRHRVCPDLLCYADEFLTWDEDGAYRVRETATIKSWSRAFLDRAVYRKPLPLPKAANHNQKKEREFELVPFLPQTKDVAELFNALKDNAHIGRDDLRPPSWLPGHGLVAPPPAKECISTPSGILHLPSSELYDPTPKFFTFNALTFEYDPEAPEPSLWLETLNQYWPPVADDVPADEVMLLQEIMGYLLTPDTSLHKLFCFHGERRGGKGTITRVIRELLGDGNVAACSLKALGEPFGMQSLINKTLTIIPEAVFGRNDDRATITGVLKAISGEDKIEIGRKHLSSWVGVLMTRIILMANKFPGFADDSKAFAGRVVPLKFSVSFEGREDTSLGDRLRPELPGILNWAIAGWKRLKQQGWTFTDTVSGRETRETIERAASPAGSFADDCCVLEGNAFITEEDLYGAFKHWCFRSGIRADSKVEFFASLEAARAQVKKYRDKGKGRRRGFKGIRLADDVEVPPREEQVEVPF
jgi:putative DNA primase/helicase